MSDERHATSDVPQEWQGLPDYLLDDLEIEAADQPQEGRDA